MIGLFHDKEGTKPYDYGKGRDYIKITKVYENGKLVDVRFPEVYLVVDGNYRDVVLEVIGKGVEISVDNSKFKKKLELGNLTKKTYKIYFKYDGKSDLSDLNLILSCEEV